MRRPDPEKEKLIRRRALEMVVKDGLDGFAMQKLARLVKVSPSTLYVYFTDRDDLLFQLYRAEMSVLMQHLTEGLAPELSFAEGLGLQWRSRLRYALKHPLESDFLDQIRHSPYQGEFKKRLGPEFFEAMRDFIIRSIERGELQRMPVELYWALALAPLYQLIHFHRNGFGLSKPLCEAKSASFKLTEEVLAQALGSVVRGLAPAPVNSLAPP